MPVSQPKPQPKPQPSATAKATRPSTAKIDANTKEAADAYKAMILKSLSPAAQKEDENLKMTGIRCARNRGSIYDV